MKNTNHTIVCLYFSGRFHKTNKTKREEKPYKRFRKDKNAFFISVWF